MECEFAPSLSHFRPPSSIRPLRPCTKRKFKFCIVDVLRIARSRAPLCARSAIMLGYYHRFRSLSSQDNLFDCLDFCYQRVVKGIEREIV